MKLIESGAAYYAVNAYAAELAIPAGMAFLAIDASGECYAYSDEPFANKTHGFWYKGDDHDVQILVGKFEMHGYDWLSTKVYIGDQTR